MGSSVLKRMKELQRKIVILSMKHTSERQFIIDGNLNIVQIRRVLKNQRVENRVLASEYADVLAKTTAKPF